MSTTPTDHQGFAMIPRWLLHDQAVTAHAKMTYAILASHADRYGRCWPSHATIARLGGMSVSTVQRALRELNALGIVAKESRRKSHGGATSNRYTIAVQLPTPVDNPVD